MEILDKDRLVSTDYNNYVVTPFKQSIGGDFYYSCEPLEAERWTVQGECKDIVFSIARFKEQDKAHQFAELLTVCLNQIKAFQDENI